MFFVLHIFFAYVNEEITFVFVGNLNFNLDELALIGLGGIGGNNSEMVSTIFRILNFRQPLECVGGQVERVQYKKIVEIRSFLLPYFILLVNDHLFLFVKLYLIKRVHSAI
jgi:hypothetical protein